MSLRNEMTDPLTYLDEVDARHEGATEGEWVARTSEATMNDRSEWRIGHPSRPKVFSAVTAAADAEFIAHARQDLPALSKALRAVLEHHAQGEAGCPHPTHKCNDPDYRGLLCADAGPECEAGCGWWPCPTVRAIRTALAVNDEGGTR